ncbi:MAG: RluA family pseudouridine synthase [Verrucomicrobiota bacterium]|nr:RluA family pseudouridine synthase [Limisphaera sp.]MDW8380646.1 RluA family pseudouridine synthase [Verrucomicrobiota bacterium]
MNEAIKLSAPHTREFWEITVLYEDESLLALDKPSGLLTCPDRYDPNRPNLMRLLHEGIALGKPWAVKRGLTYLANVHRLDFETSGVLLLAKEKTVLTALTRQFEAGTPRKRYLALVQGEPLENVFDVRARLAPDPAQPERMLVVRKRGKESHTEFRVLERFSGYALLECLPRTGRTHQIRVHLAHVRLPVVGDKLYGGSELWLSQIKPSYKLPKGAKERPLVGRVALHAHELEILHPVTRQTVTIQAPLPKDLRASLQQLRRHAPCMGVLFAACP